MLFKKFLITDMDDTLLSTNIIYTNVRDEIFALFTSLGLAKHADHGLQSLYETYNKDSLAKGNGDYFGYASVFNEMLNYLVTKKTGRTGISPFPTINDFGILKTIRDLCMSIYATTPEIIPGTEELLVWCQLNNFYTCLYSMGNMKIQNERAFGQTGIGYQFNKVYIQAEKTPDGLFQLMDVLGCTRYNTVYLGNNPILDAVPALACGLPTYIKVDGIHAKSEYPSGVTFIDNLVQMIPVLTAYSKHFESLN